MNNNSGQQLANGGNGNLVASKTERSQTGAGNANQSGLLYDFSSFDPLQAHARQLAASAGLSNLMPNGAAQINTGDSSGQAAQAQRPQHPHQVSKTQLEQQHMQQPAPQLAMHSLSQHAPQAQPRTNQPFFYMQTNNPSALHSIASNTQQTVATMMPQNVMVGQSTQSFILPATAAALGIPTNFQASLFPNTLNSTNSQGMVPGLLMAQPQSQQLVPSMSASNRQDGRSDSSQGARKKQRALEPSVVSSSTASSGEKSNGTFQEDEFQEPDVDVSKMTPAQRRRHERNMREQQRSYKISQQIKELREVLTDSNVPFKPNKYSILMCVVDYIKQLQARAIMLDAEHQKLITTIRQTNEMVHSGTTPSSADDTDATNMTGNMSSLDPGSDGEMVFVQGLNYRSLFEQCPAALGIAALDGRILECNPEFQLLLGFPREDLMKQSLFNLIRNHQDIFRAMAEMLKSAEDEPIGLDRDSPSSGVKSFVWSGSIISKRDAKVRHCIDVKPCLRFATTKLTLSFQLSMNLTLTLGNDGTPKFFSCSVTSI